MKINNISLSEWSFLSHKTPKDLIRVGSIHDGGYVTSQKAVLASEFLLSGGISFNPEFELDFHHINPNSDMILIDGSISPLHFLLGPFVRKFTGKSFTRALLRTGEYFYIKRRSRFLKEYITKKKNISYFLKKFVKTGAKGYLKLDIEGSEWELLQDIVNYQDCFTAISIEFHDVPSNIKELEKFVRQLDLKIAFIEINSGAGFLNGMPKLLEISFIRPEYLNEENEVLNLHLRRPIQLGESACIPTF